MDVTHFTLADFVASAKAKACGIDNCLPPELEHQAWATLALLEVVRAKLCALAGHDVPVVISSGYRGPSLNQVVGSGSGSDHLRAMAADIVAPRFGTPLQIAQALAPLVSVLGIGQLIYERPHGVARAWVHVSTRVPARAVNRIITITEHDTLVGVVP
jgi:zinc D-Ala-D-Ala carboxypeptidase